MADSLKDFFVELGFKVDESERRSMVESAKAAQRTVTANADQEGQTRMSREAFRQKLAATGSNDLAKVRVEAERRVTDVVDKVRTDFGKKDNQRETEAAKKAHERRESAFKEISKFALAFGAVATTTLAAVQGVATGVALAVGQAAKGFDNLNFASQRIGAAPQKISSFAYAISQLGGSVEGANDSLATFGQKLKGPSGAGFESMLQNLGVKTRDAAGNLRDSAAIATDALQSLSKRPQAESMAYANAFGFDDLTRRAGADPRLRGFEEQREREQNQVGFDPNKAAADATPVAQSMRRLEAIASDVGNKIKSDLFEKVKPLLDQLADWMAAHGADIAKVVGDIADKMVTFTMTLSEKLTSTNYKTFFGDKGGTEGLIPALEATAGAALLIETRFGGILGALTKLASFVLPGWLGWALKAGGANAALAAPYVAQNGITSIDPATAQPYEANPMGSLGPKPGEEPPLQRMWRKRPKWMGGEGSGEDDADASGSDDPLKKFIARHEGAGYDVVYGHAERGGALAPPKPITQMTIGEILAYQRQMRAQAGSPAFPVGRAQWTESTLRNLTRDMDPNTVFTPEVQEKLFDRSIAGRMGQGPQGFRSEWDSLRNVGDDEINAAIEGHRRAVVAAKNAIPPATDSKGNVVRTDAQGRAIGANGLPTTVLPAIPANPFGSLDPNAFKRPALTMSPASLYSSYDNSRSRGDTTINAPTTFNISGGDAKANLATAKLFQAGRGTPDWITNLQGSER